MSDTLDSAPPVTSPHHAADAPRRRRIPVSAGAIALIAGLVVLAALPLYLSESWLQSGLFAMAAIIGAVGLNILTGNAGQLSLGHAFFLSIGAYGYVWLAGDPSDQGSVHLSGLGLPTSLAFVLAVAVTGATGALLGPLAGRLRGMYLGIATLGLVYIGQYLMLNAPSVTGGYVGRSVPPLTVFGFSFSDHDPDTLLVLGVPFGALERLWYLGLVLVVVGCLLARNLLRGRQGRALNALGSEPTVASIMGVPAARSRAAAFVISSLYAGTAGALLALVFQRVVPDYFSLTLTINYLAMIVIGGLGSVRGSVLGAAFVALVPPVLNAYADVLPLVGTTGVPGTGIEPGVLANYIYGAALVLVLIFAPQGLAGLVRRPGLLRTRRVPAGPSAPTVPDHAGPNQDEVTP